MIRVRRGRPPGDLARVREEALRGLRPRARAGTLAGKDITGYRLESVCDALWRAQHHKCCYCELKLRQRYNDVEHYRPKGRADRLPGSTDTHGYWWLAFTWKNMLYACSTCNRSEKNDQFPLAPGDVALAAEKHPPGQENPYLLDPAACNPVAHIEFHVRPGTESWYARPRHGSVRGHWTIHVCGLNEQDLVELRSDHVENLVRPRADALCEALATGDRDRVHRAYIRARALLAPSCPFVAVSYDALAAFVPAPALAPYKRAWPRPDQVGMG